MKNHFAPLLLVACAACATTGPGPAGGPTRENFARITAGKTTANEVRALLGPPGRVLATRAVIGESWGYRYAGDFERRVFWVDVSPGGMVSATSDAPDFEAGRYRGP